MKLVHAPELEVLGQLINKVTTVPGLSYYGSTPVFHQFTNSEETAVRIYRLEDAPYQQGDIVVVPSAAEREVGISSGYEHLVNIKQLVDSCETIVRHETIYNYEWTWLAQSGVWEQQETGACNYVHHVYRNLHLVADCEERYYALTATNNSGKIVETVHPSELASLLDVMDKANMLINSWKGMWL